MPFSPLISYKPCSSVHHTCWCLILHSQPHSCVLFSTFIPPLTCQVFAPSCTLVHQIIQNMADSPDYYPLATPVFTSPHTVSAGCCNNHRTHQTVGCGTLESEHVYVWTVLVTSWPSSSSCYQSLSPSPSPVFPLAPLVEGGMIAVRFIYYSQTPPNLLN